MANQLDVAHAQFVGFRHAKWNRDDIIGLVESMGLTRAEWLKWKKDYNFGDDHNDMTLTIAEIKEIDGYFKIKKPTEV